MAEIKSTLDLVMEKTKHLSLSPEEKAEMRLQDALKSVPGYVQRVLDGAFTAEQLLSEIEALQPELCEPVREEIIRHMSQTLDLTDKTDPLIAALELLADPAWAKRLAEVKECRLQYREARDAAWQQAQAHILAKLASAGIKGTAVVAKLEDEPFWKAEENRLRQPCEKRLAAMRQALA